MISVHQTKFRLGLFFSVLLLLGLVLPTKTFAVDTSLLNVSVIDGISNTVLGNQSVTVLRREADGSLKGLRTVTTDANGKLSLDLPGLGSETVYVLRTAVKYGNKTVNSSDLSQTGHFTFKVGNVRVKVINGQSGGVLGAQPISVYKLMSDGSDVYFNNAIIDDTGLVDFDLPNLSDSQRYVFKVQNPFDSIWKISVPISQAGLTTFVVGNRLLNINVIDGIGNTPLSNQSVTVFRREADGSLKGFRSETTDVDGKLSVDLPGLGSDTTYVLRTAMKYGSQLGYSADLSQTGYFTFKVGNIRVKAVNGQTGGAFGQSRIHAYARMADGTDVYAENGGSTTDANGLADFDLPALGSGQAYVFRAQSAFDNSWRTSDEITAGGLIQFVVGNRLLHVTLTEGIGNTVLSNQAVTILRREANGSLQGLRTEISDGNGKLSLDLPGLGSDSLYVLRTAMQYGNKTANSSDLNQTGNFTFKVGNVRLKAVNGQTGAVLGAEQISVYKVMADGSDVYFSNAITDDNGLADFDLPNLSSGQRYVFRAQNHFDSTWKASAPLSQAGLTTFVVGNQLLNVSVIDGISNTPLINQSVTVFRREADGSLRGLRNVTTDAKGQLSLDLPGLGSDTVYVLRTQQLFGFGAVFSREITDTGSMEFRIGNVLVKATDGANDQPLVGQEITVLEEMIDGSLSGYIRVATDQNGNIPLHLPKLGQGGKYVLKAQTALDKRWVSSAVITHKGAFDFSVGNKLLNVQLLNVLQGKMLANVEVTAYERLPDLSLHGFQRKSTDAEGRVDFDLPGLGQGTDYVLKANPFGMTIDSQDIAQTGQFQFLAGNLAVKLYKAKTGEVLPDQALVLYEKSTDGSLVWRKSLQTDSAGVVRFDPVGLGDGRLFVVRATDVFGNGKHHYSRWISNRGWVDFAVDPEDPNKLDDEPPVFVSFKPGNNANLASQGFRLQMKITDNQKVEKVRLTLSDPVLGAFGGIASQDKGEWYFTVTNNMLTAGQWLTVNAMAYDKVGNHAEQSRQYRIINDTKPPEITVSSHQDGDQIDEHGLAILGSVTDNTAVKTLRATVTDPSKGSIVNNREIEIGANGHWGLAVRQLSRGQAIKITLSAEDWAGNQGQKALLLPVMTEPVSAANLLNRITFGATPELITELRSLGAEAFLQQQLHPELIDDSKFETYLASLLTQTPDNMIKLQNDQIAHVSYSKKQLLELMTWFWENHFSTDRTKTATQFEFAENQAFRTHALGRFRDLLEISAKSPAMLLFLDNHYSQKLAPNENYARELLELHTLGVDNGYSAQDIAEVARVFTGWRVAKDAFNFAAWNHDNGEKNVLGSIIPAGSGVAGGEMVLDLLAAHQGTARHICSKLLKLLVADQPVEASVVSCARDFIDYADQDHQIAKVLEGILKSPAFSSTANFHNKVKIPLEYVSGLFRQLPITVSYTGTRSQLRDMGMHLFYFDEPTGWPEEADQWVSSGQLMQRWQFAGQTLLKQPSLWRNNWEQPARFFIDKEIETSEAVLAYWCELLLSHDYTAMELAAANAILTTNNSERFDIYASDADERLRKAMALILNLPAYQLQ